MEKLVSRETANWFLSNHQQDLCVLIIKISFFEKIDQGDGEPKAEVADVEDQDVS